MWRGMSRDPESGLYVKLEAIIGAADAGDSAAAAAECAVALNTLPSWQAEVWPAPDAEFEALVDAFFRELSVVFSYCSEGGDETAMELAAEKYQVVFELMTRIEEKLANR